MAALKVIATRAGSYFGYRAPGDEFDIQDVQADEKINRKAKTADSFFSKVWMKPANDKMAKRVVAELARRDKVAADAKRLAAAQKGILADAQSVSSEIERMRAEIDSLVAANKESAAANEVLELERDEARDEAVKLGSAQDDLDNEGDGHIDESNTDTRV